MVMSKLVIVLLNVFAEFDAADADAVSWGKSTCDAVDFGHWIEIVVLHSLVSNHEVWKGRSRDHMRLISWQTWNLHAASLLQFLAYQDDTDALA